MPPKDPAPTEDLLQIQIAIELDRGRKVAEIASEFQVPEKKVRNIARNAGLLESKKSTSARKRLSEEEKEVLTGIQEESDLDRSKPDLQLLETPHAKKPKGARSAKVAARQRKPAAVVALKRRECPGRHVRRDGSREARWVM